MADGLRRRWKKKPAQKLPPRLVGRIFWGTSAAAAPSPASRDCGWRGSFNRERKFLRASRHTTRTRESAGCCNWHSNRCQRMPWGAWTWKRWRNEWSGEMWEPSLRPWARQQPDPWIRFPRFWNCVQSMDFEFTLTPRMADILFWRKIWGKTQGRLSNRSELSIPSSSIRTNTDCSRTDADACCFAIPAWGDFTNTTRRTPI